MTHAIPTEARKLRLLIGRRYSPNPQRRDVVRVLMLTDGEIELVAQAVIRGIALGLSAVEMIKELGYLVQYEVVKTFLRTVDYDRAAYRRLRFRRNNDRPKDDKGRFVASDGMDCLPEEPSIDTLRRRWENDGVRKDMQDRWAKDYLNRHEMPGHMGGNL